MRSLDLSCNLLTKLENLEKGKELRDLILYHNKISKIENLDR